jgi:hypothetical protein
MRWPFARRSSGDASLNRLIVMAMVIQRSLILLIKKSGWGVAAITDNSPA